MKKIKKLLHKLGLSHHEVRIYHALLELGLGTIADISKQTGLYRPAVYRALPRLLNKNLIATSQKGKRTLYLPESPKHLERLAESLTEEVKDELPELMSLYTTSSRRPIIRFFAGPKSITHVYEDLLTTCKKGDIVYRYESLKDAKAYKKYVPKAYLDRVRDKVEIERFIITNKITADLKRPRLGRIFKVVPPAYDLFIYNISQIIYGNKVALIDVNSETASIIESTAFAEFQRRLFKLLFDKL